MSDINANAAKEAKTSLWSDLVSAFLSHSNKTPELLGRMMTERPEDPMGPLVKGYMLLMLARPELRLAAEEALHEGIKRQSLAGSQNKEDSRATYYSRGLQAWLYGKPREAIHAMERVLDKNPLDAMAVKISHSIRFMLGDADGMRRSLARIVSIYTDGVPYAGYIKGCYAFALEETGEYTEAEKMGRRAVELEPTDAWGRHAVAHVYEMTGRAQDGLTWLADSDQWQHCNNFSYHMAWHIALFQLELGRTSEALTLYDRAIRSEKTDDFRDIANASSLLQRLELAGISVGNRWEELADIAERRMNDRQLAFADLHYMLALLGAGRIESAEAMVKEMILTKGEDVDSSEIAEIAVSAAAGLAAFTSGNMRKAVAFLEPIIGQLQRIGGSHAQRDVFHQTYLEALVRSGASHASKTLEHRITDRKGQNHFAHIRLQRILQSSHSGRLAEQTLMLTPRLQIH
jgi:tetratricopeptide (TPR) repeat protein